MEYAHQRLEARVKSFLFGMFVKFTKPYEYVFLEPANFSVDFPSAID